jgi:hypothetical protein
MMRILRLVVALGTSVPGVLAAQTDCFPSKTSHEAQLFAFFSGPLAFSPAQSPMVPPRGTVQASLEGVLLPNAASDIATPTTCRPGKGPENVNILPGFIRPRLGYAMGQGVLLEVSWVPPVTVKDVRPNLWSFALSRAVPLGRNTLFMGRVHASFGSLKAPFVCPTKALQSDSTQECYGTRPSNDRFSPTAFGVELGMGWLFSGGRLRPYLGAGYSILHPRFQVNFTDANGILDARKVEVNLRRLALFGGATFQPARRLMLSSEIYTTPSDVVTARATVSVLLGGTRQ